MRSSFLTRNFFYNFSLLNFPCSVNEVSYRVQYTFRYFSLYISVNPILGFNSKASSFNDFIRFIVLGMRETLSNSPEIGSSALQLPFRNRIFGQNIHKNLIFTEFALYNTNQIFWHLIGLLHFQLQNAQMIGWVRLVFESKIKINGFLGYCLLSKLFLKLF